MKQAALVVALCVVLASRTLPCHAQDNSATEVLADVPGAEVLDTDEQALAAELDELLDLYGEPLDIGEVNVTANRSLTELLGETRALTVITEDELARSISLDAALERVPGLDVRRAGGLGQLSTVQLRGSRANQVLVLLDGQRLSPAETADLSALPIGLITRIEVLRGPEAVRFGQGALGGVVNLITRRPAPRVEQPAAASIPLKEMMSNATVETAQADHTLGAFEMQAGGQSSLTLSYAAIGPDAAFFVSHLQAKNDYAFERSGGATAMRQNNEVLHDSVWAAWNSGELSQRAGFSHRRRGLPGSAEFPTLRARLAQDTLWWLAERDELRGEFVLEHTRATDPQPYLNRGPIDNSDTRVSLVLANETLAASTSGFSWRLRSDYIDSQQSGEHTRVGLDAQHGWSGRRGDYNYNVDLGLIASNDVSVDPTLRAGLSRSLNNNSELYLAAGYAVRHPDFGELYLTDTGSVQGNTELQPESVVNVESGVRWNGERVQFAGALFYSDYRDSIIFAPVSAYLVRAINTGPARVAGAEAQLDITLSEQLAWRSAFTWLPLAEFESGVELTARTDHHLNSTLQYQQAAWRGALGLDLSGSIPADLFGNLRIPARAIVNLELSRDVDNGEVGLSVANVFDESTRDAWNYPLPGREIYLSWRTDL